MISDADLYGLRVDFTDLTGLGWYELHETGLDWVQSKKHLWEYLKLVIMGRIQILMETFNEQEFQNRIVADGPEYGKNAIHDIMDDGYDSAQDKIGLQRVSSLQLPGMRCDLLSPQINTPDSQRRISVEPTKKEDTKFRNSFSFVLFFFFCFFVFLCFVFLKKKVMCCLKISYNQK